MSRSLVPVVLGLAVLAGCATSPPVQVVEKNTAETVVFSTVQQWLSLQQEVAGMSAEEVVEKLVRVNKPEGAGQQFYYGLLNQQLDTYDAWVQARDTFGQLQKSEELTVAQRQLVIILLEYNQNRINRYKLESELRQQHAALQQQLRESEQDKLLLEQKIQALTDLEAVISTRKEQ